MDFRRFFFAAALAPLALPVLFLVLKLADFSYLSSHSNYLDKLGLELLIITVSSYAVSYALGVPALLVLVRLNKLNYAWILLSASIFGAVAGLAFSVWTILVHMEADFGKWTAIFVCLACSLAGLINALMFCLLAGVKR